VTKAPSYRLPRDVVPEHYSLVFVPDPAQGNFDGEADIRLDVRGTVSELVLNAVELDITEARVVDGDGREQPAGVTWRADEEQVVLGLEKALRPGPAGLHLRFSGRLNDLLHGFYRSRFRGADGQERWIAATQFESTDARRAFPCWDEPDLKATFGITIVADEGLTMLSNAAAVSCEPVEGGKLRTRFADTMKMSTYLVAMVVGPFELTEPIVVEGVPLRIASVPGRGGLTGLAGEAAAHALSFLSNYFSIPYPADKLDHVAIPDFASGAMENLGLVTYRETALLAGPDASQTERQRIVEVVAHETAHMWFGDLVTMRWWNGIWLNEAFASFMEMLAADDFERAWDVWTNFGLDRAAALAVDGLRASRAIEYPVGRPEEAEDMFDVITYDKGCSVLRMIERYLGEDTFRRGLRHYLEAHRLANTETTDLWDSLEGASGLPVSETMGTWVNQPGHPLVTAELTGPAELRLSQRRFLLDGTDGGEICAQQRWTIPVRLRYATGGALEHGQLLLHDGVATVQLKGEPDWLLVNEQAWGVYRVAYSPDLRDRLFAALGHLDDRERLGLVSDTWAAGVAGVLPLETSFELWSALGDERDPDVWWAVSGGLSLLDLISDEASRPLLQKLARDLAGPVFEKLGWDEVLGEPARQRRARARLVMLLGTFGADDEVQLEARRLVTAASTGGAPLVPDLATAIVQVAAFNGGEREWETFHAQFKGAATPQDEIRYLHALGAFSAPGLLWRSVELAFSDEVRSQDAPYLIMFILGRRDGAEVAWEAIESRWDEIQARWPSNAVHRMLEAIPGLAALGKDGSKRATDWLDAHPTIKGELRLRQARERLGINLAFRERTRPQLASLLSRAAAGNEPRRAAPTEQEGADGGGAAHSAARPAAPAEPEHADGGGPRAI